MTTVGIIGCGNIARVHARELAKREGVSLAFCDRNLDKAKALASAHNSTKVHADLDDMLAAEQLKTLHVLTRVDSHLTIGSAALAAGVHIYVEKPITETTDEFFTLQRAAADADRVFYPGFSALGSPGVQKVMSLVRSRRYGRLVTVHCDFNWTAASGGIPYGSADHAAYRLRGGILQNLADHPASLVVHLLDDSVDWRSLRVRRSQLPHGVHDLLHVAISGPDQLGSFTMSFGHGNARGALVCHLEGGTIEVDLRTEVVTANALRGVPSQRALVSTGLKSGIAGSGRLVAYAARRASGVATSYPGIAGLIDNFYGVVDNAADPFVSIEKSAQVVGILDTVWQSEG